MPSKQAKNFVEDTGMIEAEEAARKSRRAATMARHRAQNEAQHNECKQAISQWPESTLKELQHSGDSLLPLDLWTKIFKIFCDDLEIDGVRGPSVIARELSLISRVNKDFYAASLPAFQHLSNLCLTIESAVTELRHYSPVRRFSTEHGGYDVPPSIPDPPQWDAFVSDPKSLKAAELRSLCAAMHFSTSRPKAVLIRKLMQSVSLEYPTPTPARLVFAIQCERRKHAGDKLSDSLRRAKGEQHFRESFESLSHLKASQEACWFWNFWEWFA